jgi:hypothetical protein
MNEFRKSCENETRESDESKNKVNRFELERGAIKRTDCHIIENSVLFVYTRCSYIYFIFCKLVINIIDVHILQKEKNTFYACS